MIEENKRNVEKLVQLTWNQGAFALAKAFLDVAFVYHGSFNSKPLDAPEFLDYVRTIRSAMNDFNVAVEEIVAERDTVVTHSSFSGTLAKPIFGFAPSDRVISLPVVSIYHLKHGRVRDLHSIYDVESIKKQLGAISASPAS
jgi:steroid delta-isomerase-like uncharacterized protein